jgi:hypothetical protein
LHINQLGNLNVLCDKQAFLDNLSTLIEFLNEFVILLNYSFLSMFTEVYGNGFEQPSNGFLQARQHIGLFLISTIGLIILVNMIVALKDLMLQICGVVKLVIEKVKEKFIFKKIEKMPIDIDPLKKISEPDIARSHHS